MQASRHDERAIAFFGAWTVIGLYLDGWSHIHHKPETFFTPFHAILYSGFGVGVAYFAIRGFITRQQASMDTVSSVGFVVFVVGAIGDFVWHTIFGIERDLAALLSPTHMTLMTGGLLLLSFPVRSAMQRKDGRDVTWGEFLGPWAGLTLCGLVVRFFTQFLVVYRLEGLITSPGGIRDFFEVLAFASVMVTNAVFVAIILFTVRRWQPPFGAFTVSFGLIALAERALTGPALRPGVVSAFVGGLLVDVLISRLRPSPERRRHAIAVGGVAPSLIWLAWFSGVAMDRGVHWPAELWVGTIYFAILEGLAMALLAFPKLPEPATPEPIANPPEVSSVVD